MVAHRGLKRLELALSGRLKLPLVDEPTPGMTPADRYGVMELLITLARDNDCAVLLTEHDTDAVFPTADRILVMDKRAVIADAGAAAIHVERRVWV